MEKLAIFFLVATFTSAKEMGMQYSVSNHGAYGRGYPYISGNDDPSAKSPTQAPRTTQPPTISTPGCEITCDGKLDGVYQNPFDCSGFIQCSDGVSYEKLCPDGLEFNPAVLRCDWPTTSCVVLCTAPTTSTPENPCEFSCEGKANGDYANPKDCSTYITCSNGVLYDNRPCMEGLEWSSDLGRCEFPEIANCVELCTPTTPATEFPPLTDATTSVVTEIPTQTPTTTQTPTQGPTTTQTPTQAPTTTQIPTQTPTTTHTPTEPPTTSTPENPCDFSCEGKPDGVYPNPFDCGSFIECSSTGSQVKLCPNGLEWSTVEERCDWPQIANCVVTCTPTTPSTLSPVTDATTTPAPPETTTQSYNCDVPFSCAGLLGFFEDPWNCINCYQCAPGIQVGYGSCPPIPVVKNETTDQHSPVKLLERCVNLCSNPNPSTTPVPTEEPTTTLQTTTIEPSTVPPTQSTTIEPTEPPTTTSTPVDPCAFTCVGQDTGNYKNPYFCTGYFLCLHDKTYSFWCSGGQEFNPVSKKCEEIETAGCVVGCPKVTP